MDQDFISTAQDVDSDDVEPLFVPEGDTSWMEWGLCQQTDPGVFYPEFQGSKTCNVAKRICDGCEVKLVCLEYALQFPESQDWGVWGGTTAVERADIRRARAENDGTCLADLLPKPRYEEDYFMSEVPDASSWDVDDLEREIELLAG